MAAVAPTIIIGTTKVVDTPRGRNINEVKVVTIETANTADAGDTFTFDLATVGGTTLLGTNGCKATTDGSVVVSENQTTSVTGTTITFTIIAGSDNDSRFVKVWYTQRYERWQM